jgi:hypothetical protein
MSVGPNPRPLVVAVSGASQVVDVTGGQLFQDRGGHAHTSMLNRFVDKIKNIRI